MFRSFLSRKDCCGSPEITCKEKSHILDAILRGSQTTNSRPRRSTANAASTALFRATSWIDQERQLRESSRCVLLRGAALRMMMSACLTAAAGSLLIWVSRDRLRLSPYMNIFPRISRNPHPAEGRASFPSTVVESVQNPGALQRCMWLNHSCMSFAMTARYPRRVFRRKTVPSKALRVHMFAI